MFVTEVEVCKAEGIQWNFVSGCTNVQPTLDLIEQVGFGGFGYFLDVVVFFVKGKYTLVHSVHVPSDLREHSVLNIFYVHFWS